MEVQRRGGGLPGVDIWCWREDLLATLMLALEEAFQLEKFFADDFVFQLGEPALM